MKKMNLLLIILSSLFLLSACTTSEPSSPEDKDIDLEIEVVENELQDTNGDNSEAEDPVTTTDPEPSTDSDVIPVVIEMTAKQWEFIPSIIEADEGDTVELHITSIDVSHGFSIPEYDINLRFGVGEEAQVTFIADKAGEFSFRCSVPCGSGHSSMKGTFIVN